MTLLSNRLLGQIFSFVFRFLAYLSSCTFFSSFVHRYFVNYAPLLRAVCKFSYIVCCLQPPTPVILSICKRLHFHRFL